MSDYVMEVFVDLRGEDCIRAPSLSKVPYFPENGI